MSAALDCVELQQLEAHLGQVAAQQCQPGPCHPQQLHQLAGAGRRERTRRPQAARSAGDGWTCNHQSCLQRSPQAAPSTCAAGSNSLAGHGRQQLEAGGHLQEQQQEHNTWSDTGSAPKGCLELQGLLAPCQARDVWAAFTPKCTCTALTADVHACTVWLPS